MYFTYFRSTPSNMIPRKFFFCVTGDIGMDPLCHIYNK